jgi:dUTP pyrophosphatase
MGKPVIEIELIYPDAIVPTRATEGASGYDLHAYDPKLKDGLQLAMLPGDSLKIGCGFKMAIPEGYEGQIRPRSGLFVKYGVTVGNSPGTADSDFRGEICVLLHRLRPNVLNDSNTRAEPFLINQGDRIAQMVIAKTEIALPWVGVKKLDQTARGEGGYGSTGQSADFKRAMAEGQVKALEPVTSPPPSEFTKEKEQMQMLSIPPSLQPVFRALTPAQRKRILENFGDPLDVLRKIEDMQDLSEVEAASTDKDALTYSEAFDHLYPEIIR